MFCHLLILRSSRTSSREREDNFVSLSFTDSLSLGPCVRAEGDSCLSAFWKAKEQDGASELSPKSVGIRNFFSFLPFYTHYIFFFNCCQPNTILASALSMWIFLLVSKRRRVKVTLFGRTRSRTISKVGSGAVAYAFASDLGRPLSVFADLTFAGGVG